MRGDVTVKLPIEALEIEGASSRKSFELEVDGQEVKLTLARVKNKFSVKAVEASRLLPGCSPLVPGS